MFVFRNEDNMRVMAQYYDQYFDLVNADPPYFSGPEKRAFYGRNEAKVGKYTVQRVNYGVTQTWNLPDIHWFNEVQRVGKDFIIWGANYFDFIGPVHKTPRPEELEAWLLDHPTGWIVWDKCNRGTSYNDYELAYTSFGRPTVVYRFMWNGMNQGKSLTEGHIMNGAKKRNQKRIHPTEKPIALYDWQLLNYADHNSKILSTHGGSFADALSAHKFGVAEFVGCEIDPIHFTKGTGRFYLMSKQQNMFQIQDLTTT